MAEKKKPFVKLQCSGCQRTNYYAHKSKDKSGEKLELKKYCRWCKKHTLHKEVKR